MSLHESAKHGLTWTVLEFCSKTWHAKHTKTLIRAFQAPVAGGIPEKPTGLPKQVQSLEHLDIKKLQIDMMMAQEDHTNWSHKCIAIVFFGGSNDFQFHAAMWESELCDCVVLRFWVIFWEMFMRRDKTHFQIRIFSSESRPRRWNLKELSPIQGDLGVGMIWKASPLGFHETSERPFLSWRLDCSSVGIIITLQKVFNT